MKANILFIIGIFIFVGCNDKKNEEYPAVESFPTTVGTEWHYIDETIVKKFESPTSNKVVDLDTTHLSFKVWVEKDTVLRDTIPTRVFILKIEDENALSKSYMFIDPEGLKCYAYSNAFFNAFAKKKAKISLIHDIFFPDTSIISILEATDIIFEKNPTLNLKLPLKLDTKWTYRKPNSQMALQIDKKAVGYETIKSNGKSYSCYKIIWNYLYDPSYEGISITDWISKEGLIKRQIIYDRVIITDESGNPIASSEVTSTLIIQ
jgi:hypothetical protein